MKEAACVWIERPDGQVVVTTRPNSSTIGLPGGKVDPGETFLEAAVREVLEETGIVLDPSSLKSVWTDVCRGEVDYNTRTFFVEVGDIEIPGGIETHITPRWGSVEELLENSPFVKYNKNVIDAVYCHRHGLVLTM